MLGPDMISCDASIERERTVPMEAYMLDLDLHTVTEAIPNRDIIDFDPFGSWILETGGGKGC